MKECFKYETRNSHDLFTEVEAREKLKLVSRRVYLKRAFTASQETSDEDEFGERLLNSDRS